MFKEALDLWYLLLPLAFLGGLAGGTTGFGIYLVFGPLLWAVLSPTAALATGLTAGLPALFLLWSLRKSIAWQEVQTLVLLAIPGVLLGLLLHQLAPASALQLGAAVVITASVLFYIKGSMRLPVWLGGLLAGALGTSVGFNGPPAAWSFFGKPEKEQRASTMMSLFFVSLLVTSAFLLEGALQKQSNNDFLDGYLVGCLLLLPVAAGLWTGNRLAAKIGPGIEKVALGLSLLGATLLLARALG